MCSDDKTYQLYQEVNRKTLAENRAFDRVFNQLPPEQQRLIDEPLGALLFATIQAAARIKKQHRRKRL